MAKITRQTLLVFGINAGGADIGVFGSLAAGSPTYSNVISTIQSLPAWGTGWAAETIATNRPALEDMNAVCHVLSYGICYLHEMGIPEWDYGTTYYTNSYAQVNGVVYISLQNNNINHDPTASPTYWALAFLTGSYLDTDITLAANSDSRIATQRATKAYVDNTKPSLGIWTIKSVNTVYQAVTDGFVIVPNASIDPYGNTVNIYTDSSNPPTTGRALTSTGSGTTQLVTQLMVPVRKNDYWKVTTTGNTPTVYWISLSS